VLIKLDEDSKCPFCLIVCGHEDLTLDLFPGLREYFSQTDEVHTVPRIPVMHAMVNSVLMKDQKLQESETKTKQTDNKILDMVDEESEDDDDYQVPQADLEEEPTKSDSDAKSSGTSREVPYGARSY